MRAGPGTPGGEYLRRFWHPVARTAQVGELPLALRRFGEDLVLFRDRGGRFGLVHRHCPHRNASLEFGIVQPRGIRCCYHGWHFDVDGALLDAPAEPESVRLDQRVRLGAYPVREYRGLVFAYLGPPEEQPPFPRFDTCEIEGGELLPYEVPMDCNWLQIAENSMDPMHVVFLHTRVNRVQFSEKLGILPVLRWFERPIGFFYTKGRRMGDFVWIATNDVVLPNFTQAGAVFESTDGKSPKYFGRNSFTRWIVPVDDTHATVLAFRHFNRRAEGSREEWRTPEALEQIDITRLRNRPYRERQRDPGDYEAIAGQGPDHPARPGAPRLLRHRRRALSPPAAGGDRQPEGRPGALAAGRAPEQPGPHLRQRHRDPHAGRPGGGRRAGDRRAVEPGSGRSTRAPTTCKGRCATRIWPSSSPRSTGSGGGPLVAPDDRNAAFLAMTRHPTGSVAGTGTLSRPAVAHRASAATNRTREAGGPPAPPEEGPGRRGERGRTEAPG